MKRKGKVRKMWIGFCDGELHLYRSPDYYDSVRHADLFATRADARKCYQDVRRVTVELVERKRGKRNG